MATVNIIFKKIFFFSLSRFARFLSPFEEEERRLKEWEKKFDLEQKKKEEELIKKFYSDNSSNKTEPEEKND